MTSITTRAWNWQPSTRAVIGLAVLAVSMSFAASAVAAIALARIGPQVHRIDDLQKSQRRMVMAARKQSHAACERSMKISPTLVDDYRDRRVFQRYLGEKAGDLLLAEAIATIPKKCP